MPARSALHRVSALVGVALLTACSPKSGSADGNDAIGCESGGKCDDATTEPDSDSEAAVCVAVRGNGPLITSHFGAMASIVERHGVVDGVAGGSSGSITSFLTESMMNNPLLYDCRSEVDYASIDAFPFDLEQGLVAETLIPDEESACTPAQSRARAALLYKSLLGYAQALGDTDEALAFRAVLALRSANDTIVEEGVDADLEDADPEQVAEDQDDNHPAVEAFRGVLTLLGSGDLRGILAVDQILGALASRPRLAVALAKDIVGALKDAVVFKPADHRMFIRPGLVDFEQVGSKLGRLASFYAGPALRGPVTELEEAPAVALDSALMETLSVNGYGPYWELTAVENGADLGRLPAEIGSFDHGMRTFFDSCAEPSVGMTWDELAELPAADTTCGDLFASLATTYRETFVEREDWLNNRADDVIGSLGRTPSRMITIATTGVLVSDRAIDAFHESTETYWETADVPAELWNSNVVLADPANEPSDVGLGYWGTDAILSTIEADIGRDDIKSRLFTPLGPATWGEILSASPAEPGLAAGVELTATNASGQQVISVGGWSDPHPTMVLEATGACDRIVYITKRGEEGTFARGVQANLGGGPIEGAFYDLDDPVSAVNASLRAADEIVCTNWDAFSPAQVGEVFADGYEGADLLTPGGAGPQIRGCSPRG